MHLMTSNSIIMCFAFQSELKQSWITSTYFFYSLVYFSKQCFVTLSPPFHFKSHHHRRAANETISVFTPKSQNLRWGVLWFSRFLLWYIARIFSLTSFTCFIHIFPLKHRGKVVQCLIKLISSLLSNKGLIGMVACSSTSLFKKHQDIYSSK